MNAAVVVNGLEDEQGRALFVVSALYHCVDALRNRVIRFVAVKSVVVEIALGVFAYDTGLSVETVDADPAETDDGRVFADASLYVAVVCDDDRPVAPEKAAACGVMPLIAMQFPPPERLNAAIVTRLAAAHDPKRFADAIRAALR